MSVTDLHPEDLLDRDARGSLTPSERTLLDAHLAQCAACRLERQVRLDFRAELDEELPLHSGSLVTKALELSSAKKSAEPPAADDTAEESEPKIALRPPLTLRPRGRTASRRARVLVLIAATLTLASAAAAARFTGVLAPLFDSSTPPELVGPPAPPPTASATHAAPHRAAHPIPAPTDEVVASPDSTDDPTVVAPPVPAPDPAPVAPAPVHVQAPRVASTAAAPVTAFAPPSMPAPIAPPAPVADEPTGAAFLFSQANDARRQGDHVRAARFYRRLIDVHGDASEAGPARVALGRLLLDDGDAAGALPFFEQYLRSGDGALREEAMFGRARALQRQGRTDDESSAWSTLLESYPRSIHAPRARARLEELGRR